MLVWAATFPHRCDTADTVGAALVAAVSGLGYRRVAERVERPATTVRGWLRRARVNSDVVRAEATMALHALDPDTGPITPAGSALGELIEVVGLATAAAVRRFGADRAAVAARHRDHQRRAPGGPPDTAMAPHRLTTPASTRPHTDPRHRQ